MNLLIIIIIVVNILMSVNGFNQQQFFNQYKFSIKAIKNGAYYRLISSGFLHADLVHLAFNMYGLYMFAAVLQSYVGSIGFVMIYLFSLIGGNLLTYFLQFKNVNYNAVGASGAVSGIVFASILAFPQMELFVFPLPIAIKAPFFGLFFILFSLYGIQKQLGNIGHEAHLGGAITGGVMMVFMEPVLLLNTKVVLLLLMPMLFLGLYYWKVKK